MKNSGVMTLVFLATLMLFLTSSMHLVLATNYHDYYGSYSDDEWRTYDELYENPDISPRMVVGVPRTFGGCYIAQDTGTLLDDLDCDKIADIQDNCLGLANPDQLDQNLNGRGDACDLVVETIEIDPEYVLEGRSFLIKTRLMNNRETPIKNMLLKIQIPELGLETSKIVSELKADTLDEYEFLLRAPSCVSKNNYGLVLLVEFPGLPGVKEFFYIPSNIEFMHSGVCSDDYIGPNSGKTLVDIIEMQDVNSLAGGVYPFTIKNTASESQAYILQAEGYEDWGSVTINPGSLIVVPAGETREGSLIVKSNEDAEGTKAFQLTIKSKEDYEKVLLNAVITQDDIVVPSRNLQLIYAIVFIVIILAILAVFSMKQDQRKK